MEDDEAADEDAADPVARVIALALDWSQDGRVERSTLDHILDEVGLPAQLFGELKDALASAGIWLYEAETPPDHGEVDDEKGWDRSALDIFMRQSRHGLLTAEEEAALADRIELGRLARQALAELSDLPDDFRRELQRRVADGGRAADEFVLHNIRLVISIAKRHQRRLGAGMSFEDLVQEGYFGLARAVEKFDASRGFKFSTYATWWVRQSVERAIANQSRTVRLPVHVMEELRQYWRAERVLTAWGRSVSDEAIAKRMQMTPGRVARLREIAQPAVSLNAPLNGAQVNLGALVGDRRLASVEDQVIGRNLPSALDEWLRKCLADREREVIERRFGLAGDRPETLEEVGAKFGVTRERIRQIEKKAITKLRQSPLSRGWTTEEI